MIANVFVDSQDDIRLILLLIYKTIIIIRRPIIIGLSNCPAISPQHRTSHTRKWVLRPKYTSAVHICALSALRRFRHQDGSRIAGNLKPRGRSFRTLLRLSILWKPSAKSDIFLNNFELWMNKTQLPAPAAFHFLYSTSTKNIDAYSSSLLLYRICS